MNDVALNGCRERPCNLSGLYEGRMRTHKECSAALEKKIEILEQQKKSLQKDLTSEIKSSAGDKHETGRAMIQLELEKLGNQIHKIELNYQRLNTIKDFKAS